MIQRLLYSVAFAAALSIIQTESAEFSIKPNGKVSHEKTSIGDVICVFSYSAHGGTDEISSIVFSSVVYHLLFHKMLVVGFALWTISMEKLPTEGYICTIERPSRTSYLYFQTYSASVLGYVIENAEVFDNSGAVLQYDKFVIEDGAVKPATQGVNIVKIVLTVKEKQK